MNRSTPGLPVGHQLPEFIQTHAIQPSHPLGHAAKLTFPSSLLYYLQKYQYHNKTNPNTGLQICKKSNQSILLRIKIIIDDSHFSNNKSSQILI